MSMHNLVPTTVNFHLVKECDYSCSHCFAGFAYAEKRLSTERALRIVERIATAAPLFGAFQIDKLTFAGGEPALHPDLPELVKRAKSLGLTTCVVTNGSRLAIHAHVRDALLPSLDWLAVSLDGGSEGTNARIGRGRGDAVARVLSLVDHVRAEAPHVRVKLNSVVNALNWTESFAELLARLKPDRWKVLQVTRLEGENDDRFDAVAITSEQFESFVARHRSIASVPLVPEREDQIHESYLMVDPEGRMFGNAGGRLVRGASLLEATLEQAARSAGWKPEKFVDRGGSYDWRAGA